MDNNQLMQAVENRVLVPQELTLLKNGSQIQQDVIKFKVATAATSVTNCSSDEISDALRLCFQKLGIRAANLPTPEEKFVLLDFIYSNYGKHTLNEIILAFDLAIIGKLDVDATHYENFTCLYLASIISAYRKWAVEQSKMIKPKNFLLMEQENKTITDEEKAEWIIEWKSKDAITIDLIPLLFYDFLSEKKIINLTTVEKWDYTVKATTSVKVQLQAEMDVCKTNNAYIAYNQFCNMEEKGFIGEFKGRILNKAKRLIVYDYLKANS